MSELDISEMKFNFSDVGEFLKASKCIYTWDFNLEGKRHKVELAHSRIKGKRVIMFDGEEINSCIKYTYNYTYSFPYDGHYITAVDIAILRIGINEVNPNYLVYLINSPWFKEQIKPYESGTTRKRISRKNLNKIETIMN